MNEQFLTKETIEDTRKRIDELADYYFTTWQSMTNSGEFLQGDLRAETFIKLYSRARTFKFNYNSFIQELVRCTTGEIAKKIKTGELGSDDLKHYIEHIYKQNRVDLFIGCFSLFEDAVTLLLSSILSDEEVKNLAKSPIDLLKGDQQKILQNNYADIYSKLAKKEPFIELGRKMRKLAKVSSLSEDDVKFVEFCIQIRNTIHSNFIYHSNKPDPYQYDDGGVVRKLENGKAFTMFENDAISWVRRLGEIYEKSVRAVPRTSFDFLEDNAPSRSYMIIVDHEASPVAALRGKFGLLISWIMNKLGR